jgi:hypothetical protein
VARLALGIYSRCVSIHPDPQPFVYGGEPPAPELPDAPEYRPEFTHPKGFVKPGFSADFERRAEPEVIDLDDALQVGDAKERARPKLSLLRLSSHSSWFV